MATVAGLLAWEPDKELTPSWLVVEIEVLEEDQVRGLFPPVRTFLSVYCE